MRSRYGIVELDFEISKSIRYHAYRRSFWEGLALPWQFKGTFRGISVGYEFRIGKVKRRRYLWKRKNCQSSDRSPARLAVRLPPGSAPRSATGAGTRTTRADPTRCRRRRLQTTPTDQYVQDTGSLLPVRSLRPSNSQTDGPAGGRVRPAA